MRFTHLQSLLSTTLILSLLTPSLALAQEPYPVPQPVGTPTAQAAPTRTHWEWQSSSGKRKLVGFGTMFAGFVVALTAFDGDGTCGSTGTTVKIEGYQTQCVYSGPSYISVTDEASTYTLARPTQELVGWGMVGGGLLLAVLPLPKRVKTYAPDLTVSANTVTVGKTVRW